MEMRHVFLFFIVSICAIETLAKRSCESECSETQFPRCGTWLQSDNLGSVSGIYYLGGGFMNLTCSYSYLPKPDTIQWRYKHNVNDEWRSLKCASSRTVTHCSYNEIKEHQVSTSCILRVSNLTQTGLYQCASGGTLDNPVTAGAAHIRVYGVENMTAPKQESLWFGRSGELKVKVCANPKPEVIWIHDRSGQVVSEGMGRMAILPLHHYVPPSPANQTNFEPARTTRFCYVARLLISNIARGDDRFRVIASNSVESKEILVKSYVFGVPLSASDTNSKANLVIIAVSMLMLCFFGIPKLIGIK